MGKTERPLLKGKTPEELRDFITCQLAAREQYYTQARHVFSDREEVIRTGNR